MSDGKKEVFPGHPQSAENRSQIGGESDHCGDQVFGPKGGLADSWSVSGKRCTGYDHGGPSVVES